MAAIGTPVSLGTNKAIDTSADLTVTLSRAFTTNALVFCAVVLKREDSTDPIDPAAPTGGGVTWAQETSYTYKATGVQRAKIVVYRGLASSPSGTSVVIAPGQTVSNLLSYVIEVTGTVLTGNGADALVQEVTALAGATSTGPRAAMTTLASADNGFLTFGSFTRGGAARTFTPIGPTTPTELGEQNNVAASTGTAGIQAQYVLAALDVNPSIGFDLSGAPDNSGIVAYEIAAGPVGPTITSQPTAQTARVNGDTTTTATFSVTATTSGGALTYDWELETSVGGGSYSNLADGNGATWTGQAASSCVGTFTAKTLSGRRVRCNVTDSNGTTTSTAVTLTVLDGPVLSASTATTNGSGVASVTMTSDDALTANGEILLVTASINGEVIARTTVRPA